LGSLGISPDIDSHYQLTVEQTEFYRENGFIKLKQVFSPDVIAYYRDEISRKVIELNTETRPLSERSTYDKAFLQVTNLWTKSAQVKQFVFGKRLARIAAELMQVRGVRLWHDQALYKEPGGGITPWQADQYYWPLSSDKSITAWIPLQETLLEMGTVAFAPGSFRIETGRDL
jgi:ectoine hydroxylase-related dioxygenase (phytanoyl-CoA dioxygenase family)